jgi:hypothetical protein
MQISIIRGKGACSRWVAKPSQNVFSEKQLQRSADGDAAEREQAPSPRSVYLLRLRMYLLPPSRAGSLPRQIGGG